MASGEFVGRLQDPGPFGKGVFCDQPLRHHRVREVFVAAASRRGGRRFVSSLGLHSGNGETG